MEPLVALALAGNVIQFVDFGRKLLSGSSELYRSSTGSLAANDEIELATADLKALINKLRRSFVPWSKNSTPNQHDQDTLASFRQVCDEAVKVADELVVRLSKLKVNSKHQTLSSLQQAVKSLWNAGEVAGLRNRLSSLKETLETHVIFSIREGLDHESLRASARFDSLDRQTQQIITSMLEASVNSNKTMSQEFHDGMGALIITITQLLRRLEHSNQDSHRRTRNMIRDRICKDQNYPPLDHQIIAGIEMLDVSDTLEQQLRAALHDSITKSLVYTSMNHRYEDVIEAHPNTFEWAFKNPTATQLPWSNLADWLKTGDGVYWVCGKAGSGKSTFMKHLYDDCRTRTFLKRWAGDYPLEQKSQMGLLRSLLHQVLTQCPELVPLVFPKIWARCYSKAVQEDWTPKNLSESWGLQQLIHALRALVHQTSIPLKICFIVDGLDEFEGDHEEMGTLFEEFTTSKNVKVCLSSRPWVVFECRFDRSPLLRLENLTYPDIEQYVSDKLRLNNAYQQLADREPSAAEDLASEIVHKADGVFLWVKLVVHSLLSGIRNRDTIADLFERLVLMPRELIPLYSRLLKLVEPIYLPWVSKAFQILRANRNHIESPFKGSFSRCPGHSPLTLSAFFLAMNEDVDVAILQGSARTLIRSKFEKETSLEQLTLPSFLPINQDNLDIDPLIKTTRAALQRKCEDTMVQLTARCAGFLEIARSNKNVSRDSLVQYFHRTARDFVESEENWSNLLLHTRNTDFDPNTAMMRSCVITLQLDPFLIEAQNWAVDRDSITKVVKDCILYAHSADANCHSHVAQIALLYQLSDMLDRHDSMELFTSPLNESEWIFDLMPHATKSFNFLELATCYNLKSYVRFRMTWQQESQQQQLSTFLLCNLLPNKDDHVHNGLPLPTLEMVQLLLDFGADPNATACGATSPWNNLLTYQANILHASSCESLRDEDYDPTALQRRYIDIMLLLLSSGANTETPVMDHQRIWRTAIEVVESILISAFPLEAAPLLRELQAKSENKSKSKGKRQHDDLNEIFLAPKKQRARGVSL